MDLIVYLRKTEGAGCMFVFYDEVVFTGNNTVSPLYQNVYFFTSQHVLSAVANMLFDVAVLEFLCSQSPYSMKGLLLGFYFSSKYFFEGLAVVLSLPFGAAWKVNSLSCGNGFYLTIMIIGLLELLVFVCVSRKYKYREVNEPSHEYRYAEDYYSNFQ